MAFFVHEIIYISVDHRLLLLFRNTKYLCTKNIILSLYEKNLSQATLRNLFEKGGIPINEIF